MFNNNSISISVSDDEPDELGRMRVRVRRKRKKTGHRLKNEFLHRVVRKLVRYWALLLIFLPALGLLLYEASRIGRKPSSVANTELGASEKSTLVDSELSNVTNPSLVDLDVFRRNPAVPRAGIGLERKGKWRRFNTVRSRPSEWRVALVMEGEGDGCAKEEGGGGCRGC